MPMIETVIVGAGPYGLSIAAHLKQTGLPFQILGTPMEIWRNHMPAGMYLKSEPFASNLWDPERRYTLEQFCKERNLPYQSIGNPVSLERFLEYTEWFRRHAVGNVIDIKVRTIRRDAAGFNLELVDGCRIEARNVILATGPMAFRFVPPEIAHLPAPLCLHSVDIQEPREFAGRDVTMLGGGQAALETAALLHECGAVVRLVVRGGAIQWNQGHPKKSLLNKILLPDVGLGEGWREWAVSELPQWFPRLFPCEKRHRFVATSYGPSGAWWLRKRVDGPVETRLNTSVRSAVEESGRVRLSLSGPSGPAEIVTDHVVAATGFQIDFERLDILEPALKAMLIREGKFPRLSSQFETSVPGLFIVGIISAPTFGPVMRFMFGAKHVGPVIARHLKRRKAILSFVSSH
jgi:thioredoxin reductase